MNDPLHLGVIGAGRIAQSAHLPAIARSRRVVLAGIADPSVRLRETVARRYDTRAYARAEALLERRDLDAVIVAVPDRLHLDVASAALEAGKHVLIEKPLAPTVGEATTLAERVESSGLVLQVGAMKRHDPGVRAAATAIRERLGEVLSASLWYRVMAELRPPTEATHMPPMVVDDEVRAREQAHKADRTRYLLTTHGAHVLDGLRLLVGDPVALAAQHATHGADHTWHVQVRLGGGGLASVEITANIHGEWSEGAEICGAQGTVRLRTHFPLLLQASDVEVFDERHRRAIRPVHPEGSAYTHQLEAFARAVCDGEPPKPDAADGLAAVRLIEAVRRSVDADGAWVQP